MQRSARNQFLVVASKQATRNPSPSVQQMHPGAIIQRAEENPDSLTLQNVLQLQRTMGNHATSRLLTPATVNTSAIGIRVAALMQRAQTAGAIRAALAADPSLGAAIQAFFAMGNDNPHLNSLLALAFPGGGPPAAVNESTDKTMDKPEQTTTDKAGTGAGATLPGARTGNKALTKGTYKWSLSAETTSRPKFTADFKPDHTKVEADAVSFVQTVVNQQGAKRFYPGGTRADPAKEKSTYEPFEEPTKHTRIDFHPDTENDPYYGAQWDQATKTWVKEATPGSGVGSSEKGVSSTSATMQDPPERDPVAREGKGDVVSEFETVPMVLETREPLGALKWGVKIKDEADAPI
ncbi:MAG TPA: hypothetical protein VFN91_04470, partial [Myxococcaceae bacterium]|nr:hypothetical protein [Myxococcaceae bacterium]